MGVIVIIGLLGYLVLNKDKTTSTPAATPSATAIAKTATPTPTPANSLKFTDTKTSVSFYYDKTITGTFKVETYTVTDYVAVGYGAPVYKKYNTSTNTWASYESDENNKKVINNANSPKLALTKFNGKPVVSETAGDSTTGRKYLLVVSGNTIYRIWFPALVGMDDNGNSVDNSAQLKLQNDNVETVISSLTIK